MTDKDTGAQEKASAPDAGIEFRATIRFPQKDYEFMQQLIKDGEYTNITEIVRDAVKRFRLDWRDMEAVRSFMPMGPMMGMRMMPKMKMMMQQMQEDGQRDGSRERE